VYPDVSITAFVVAKGEVGMNMHQDVYTRLEGVKRLWVELLATPRRSPCYKALVDEIHAECIAYRAGVDADRGVDRRRLQEDRRQNGKDLRARRINRRQFGERR
jgi:hypothetical protein